MSKQGRGFTFLPLISAAGRTQHEEGEHSQTQAEPAPRYLQRQYWCSSGEDGNAPGEGDTWYWIKMQVRICPQITKSKNKEKLLLNDLMVSRQHLSGEAVSNQAEETTRKPSGLLQIWKQGSLTQVKRRIATIPVSNYTNRRESKQGNPEIFAQFFGLVSWAQLPPSFSPSTSLALKMINTASKKGGSS